ncbi:hypothetical protein [Streptomyces platensis]|nr:hypothetical protein OG962_19670 [Streptomyces platensis]
MSGGMRLLPWNGPAEATARELRFCVHRLREALRDALRIAESRGERRA